MRYSGLRFNLVDGVAEILFGLAALLAGGVALAGMLLFPDWPETIWWIQLLVWVMGAGIMNTRYQRRRLEGAEGYVETMTSRGAAVHGLILAAAGWAMILLAMMVLPDAAMDPLLWLGAAGVILAAQGVLVRLPRLVLVGLVSAALAVWLVWEGVPMALVIYLEAFGLMEVTAGLVAWRRYHGSQRTEPGQGHA